MNNHSLKIFKSFVFYVLLFLSYMLTGQTPYPGLSSKLSGGNTEFKFTSGKYEYNGEITVKDGKTKKIFSLTQRNLKRQNIILSVLPENRHGAIIWKVKLHNQGKIERFFELRLKLSGNFSQKANYYDGFDNHKIKNKIICRNDIDETIPLGIYYNTSYGIALGLTPLTLTSYFENCFDKNSISCAVRTVIPPGKAVKFNFVAFGFKPNWGFKDGINLYHNIFAAVFSSRKNVDPRLFTGTDALACGRVSGTYYAGKHKRNPNKFKKQAFAGWGGHEWVYAPYRRCGDWLVRKKLWDWNMPAKDATAIVRRDKSAKRCDLMNFNNFKKQRRAMFNYMDYNMNILPCFYIINWIEGDLLTRLDGMKYNYANSSSKAKMLRWVTTTSDEYHVFPWASVMQKTIEKDVPELIKELNLTAFALDCAGNKTKYRGPLDHFIPGWAYDEKGKYISTGIGHSLLLDYIHKQQNDEFRMGVISNGANPFCVANRVETSLFEHKTMPHVNYKNFQKTRLFMGNKVLQLHSGAGFFNPALDVNWPELSSEQIKIYYQHAINKSLIGCWQTGFLPSTSYQMGNETYARMIPKLTGILNKGYRCVPGIDGDKKLERTRYGRKLDSVVAISNSLNKEIISSEKLLSRYFADGAVVPFDYDGKKLNFNINNNSFICEFPLNVAPGETRLIETTMSIKTPTGQIFAGTSYAAKHIDRREAVAVLSFPQASSAILQINIPDNYLLSSLKLNNKNLELAKQQKIAFNAGKNEIVAVFKSIIFGATEKELVEFPFSKSKVNVSSNATAREKGAADYLKNFIRLFLPKSKNKSYEIFIGTQYGKMIFIKNKQLFIGGKNSFTLQQNLTRLLRLVLDKRKFVEPYGLHYPSKPTSQMLNKVGVNKSNYFPTVEITGKTSIPKATIKAIAIRDNSKKTSLPTVSVLQNLEGPCLDGKLDDTVWKNAAEISLMTPLAKGGKIYDKTTCRLFFSKDMLWLGVKCDTPNASMLAFKKIEHDDDKIWISNEHLEIFLAPGKAEDCKQYPFYQLIVDSSGNIWDSWNRKTTWNADAKVKVLHNKNNWTAEIGIPLKNLKNSQSANWRFNIARFDSFRNSWSSWSPVLARLQRPAKFGILVRGNSEGKLNSKIKKTAKEMKGIHASPLKAYLQIEAESYNFMLKIPQIKPENISKINMYFNIDPGEKTGRLGLLEGADWRLTVDVANNKITVLKYRLITKDTPKSQYSRQISRHAVPQYDIQVTRKDDNYYIKLDNKVFKEMPIRPGTKTLVTINTKDKKQISGSFKYK